MRVVVDLPFVPTTCTPDSPACGSPSAASSARIRSSPKPSRGHGESASSQATCVSLAEGVELAPVPLELRALGLDHVGRRVRDEPLVREHPLGPRDLLREARPLGLDVPVRLAPLGPDDGREDPPLVVRAELDLDAAAAEDAAPPPARGRARPAASAYARVRLRPRRDDQPRVAAGRCDQISSVTCGISGWSSASSRSSAASAVARQSSSPSYSRGLIASAYQSQKSSKVRW